MSRADVNAPSREAQALDRLLRWVAEPRLAGRPNAIRATHHRAVAVLWTLSPGAFGGVSARQLAGRLGIGPHRFLEVTRAVRRDFPALRNAYHVHDWRRH